MHACGVKCDIPNHGLALRLVLGQVAGVSSDDILAMFNTVVGLSRGLDLRWSVRAHDLSFLVMYAEYRTVSEQVMAGVTQKKLPYFVTTS